MKIAVFHHGVLSTPRANLGDGALEVLMEQLEDLRQSGLADAATELHFGMNDSDALMVASLLPAKATMHLTGDGSLGEQPTLLALQQWLPGHEDWMVCYHHMKACTTGRNEARRCMAEAVIWNWEQCLRDLKAGWDAVGCHWLDWHKDAVYPGQRYFGGTFWWTTGKYLSELAPLDPKVDGNGKYYEGEVWIGRHPRETLHMRDYHRPGRPCTL